MTENEHTHASQLALERFLLGELVADERRHLVRELADCPECRRRLAETEADDRAFALRPMPECVRAETRPAPAMQSFLRPRLLWVPAAAAAALVAFLLWPAAPLRSGAGIAEIGSRGAPGSVRLMGGESAETPLSLGFYVSRGGGTRSVGRSGDALAAGDRIQFWYDSAGASAFALVGVDGRGEVTTYFSSTAGAGGLARGRGLSLGAVELDDAVGAERFFLCTGASATDVAAVERAASRLVASGIDLARSERLPYACDQASFWIRKE
jgi:hypothetical protein